MSHQEKMAEAIGRAYARGLISDEIMGQLPSIEQLVIGIVVVGGVLIGLGVAAGAVASTGVGAVLEGIAAGIVVALAAVGIFSSAEQIVAGVGTLMTFYTATKTATTYSDIDVAGRDFAAGLAEVGVGTIMMILSVLGARQGIRMGKGAAGKRNASGASRDAPARPSPNAAAGAKAEAEAEAKAALVEQMRLRARQLELGTDPARGYIEAEGIGGVHIEQSLGRTIARSRDPAVDFVDSKLGPISLKGPIPASGSVEGLAEAVVKDARFNTATKAVFVDLSSLSAEHAGTVRALVETSGASASKAIFFMR